MARERPVFLDDDDPPPKRSSETKQPDSRFGFEWGLASTLIGIALLIAGTGAMIICLALWSLGGPEQGRGIDLQLARIAGAVMGCGALLLSIAGFLFGIRGLARARQAGQPAALPLAGMLLGIAATLLWLIVTVDFFMIIESFLRNRDY